MTLTVPPHVLAPSPRSERAWRASMIVLAAVLVLLLTGLLAAQSTWSWWVHRGYSPTAAQIALPGASSVSVRTTVGDVEVVLGDVAEPTVGLVDDGSQLLPGPDATALARVTVEGPASSPTVTVEQPGMAGPVPWQDEHKQVLLVIPAGGLSSVDLSTEVGDVSVTGPVGRVSVGTGTGDVQVLEVPADAAVSATTGVGAIDVQVDAVGPASDLDLSSEVGDIAVLVPSGGGWVVQGSAETGDVHLDPGVETGGTGARIRAQSGVGDVSVIDAG